MESEMDYYVVFGDGQFNSNQTLQINSLNYTITALVDVNGNTQNHIDSDVSPDIFTQDNSGEMPVGLPFMTITTPIIGGAVDNFGFGLQSSCSVVSCAGITVTSF